MFPFGSSAAARRPQPQRAAQVGAGSRRALRAVAATEAPSSDEPKKARVTKPKKEVKIKFDDIQVGQELEGTVVSRPSGVCEENTSVRRLASD